MRMLSKIKPLSTLYYAIFVIRFHILPIQSLYTWPFDEHMFVCSFLLGRENLELNKIPVTFHTSLKEKSGTEENWKVEIYFLFRMFDVRIIMKSRESVFVDLFSWKTANQNPNNVLSLKDSAFTANSLLKLLVFIWAQTNKQTHYSLFARIQWTEFTHGLCFVRFCLNMHFRTMWIESKLSRGKIVIKLDKGRSK